MVTSEPPVTTIALARNEKASTTAAGLSPRTTVEKDTRDTRSSTTRAPAQIATALGDVAQKAATVMASSSTSFTRASSRCMGVSPGT